MKRILLMFFTLISLVINCISCSSTIPVTSASSSPQIESKSPGIIKRYDSFYIGSIHAYTVEGDYLRRIEDREIQKLADDFRRKLIANLGNKYSPLPHSTKNTAIINVSITDVATNYAAFQLAPGLMIPNAMRGGASMDARVIDSVTKEQVVRVRDSRSGARQGYFSGLGKWDGAERAFEEWAQMLAGAIAP